MRPFTLFSALLIVVACASEPQPPADRPANPVMEQLQAPVTNPPLRVPAGTARAPDAAQLPAGQASALIITRDGRPFAGTLNAAGTFTVQADLIRFAPAQGSALDLRYRLPTGLALARQATFQGQLTLSEASSPAGTDRTMLVRDDAGALLAEVWTQAAEPVSFDVGNGMRLVQQVTRGAAGRYTPAAVSVIDGDRTVSQLAVGERMRVTARAGTYDVLVEGSSLYTPSPADADQYRGGYILHAWITAVR